MTFITLPYPRTSEARTVDSLQRFLPYLAAAMHRSYARTVNIAENDALAREGKYANNFVCDLQNTQKVLTFPYTKRA
jgi:hypothetical protein